MTRNDIDIAKDNAIRDAETLLSAAENAIVHLRNDLYKNRVTNALGILADPMKELEASLDDLRSLVDADKAGDAIDHAEYLLGDR